MAPALDFFKRDYVCDSYNNCWYRSRWHEWGRWVVLGLAIALFFLTLAYCMITSRRRRRQGVAPMYGTGWISNGQKWGAQPQQQNAYPMYDYNQQGYNPNYPPPNGEYQNVYPPAPPPPAYGQHQQPQHTGTTFNTNDGYYATGAGVQPPHGTHQRDEVYAPPQGPPPAKS